MAQFQAMSDIANWWNVSLWMFAFRLAHKRLAKYFCARRITKFWCTPFLLSRNCFPLHAFSVPAGYITMKLIEYWLNYARYLVICNIVCLELQSIEATRWKVLVCVSIYYRERSMLHGFYGYSQAILRMKIIVRWVIILCIIFSQ